MEKRTISLYRHCDDQRKRRCCSVFWKSFSPPLPTSFWSSRTRVLHHCRWGCGRGSAERVPLHILVEMPVTHASSSGNWCPFLYHSNRLSLAAHIIWSLAPFILIRDICCVFTISFFLLQRARGTATGAGRVGSSAIRHKTPRVDTHKETSPEKHTKISTLAIRRKET